MSTPRRLLPLGSTLLALGGLLFAISSFSERATAHTTSLLSDPVTVTMESWGASGAEIGPVLVDMDNVSGWVRFSSLAGAIAGQTATYCFTVINLGTTDIEFSSPFGAPSALVPGQTWSYVGSAGGAVEFRAPNGTTAKFLYKIKILY